MPRSFSGNAAMKQLFPLRRLFHLSGCLIPVVYLLTNKRVALLVAAAAIVAVAFIEALRIKGCIRLGFVEALLKERELKGPTGSLFYLVSCLATILFFDKRIASASIFVLAVSDPISSIVGSKWGRRSFPWKIGGRDSRLLFLVRSCSCLLLLQMAGHYCSRGRCMRSRALLVEVRRRQPCHPDRRRAGARRAGPLRLPCPSFPGFRISF